MKSLSFLSLLAASTLILGACNSTKTNTAQEVPAVEEGSATTTAAAVPAPSQPAPATAVAQVVSVDKGGLSGNVVGQKAPNFKWRGADGVEHSLAEFKGKTVLLNFWATWCPPCRRELPDLVNIHTTMDPGKVVVIGVSLDVEAPEGMGVADYVAEFSQKNKLTFPMVIGNGDLVKAYGGIEGIPTTFIINPQGAIAEQMVGARDEATFRKSIEASM
jgi:peroxiredoxin